MTTYPPTCILTEADILAGRDDDCTAHGHEEAPALTREEAAYAHLASFKAGDVVDVSGPRFYLPGIVDTPQRDAGEDITRAYLTVAGSEGVAGTFEIVTVAALLSGHRTIGLRSEVKAGNVRYFDEAGYTMQNGTCGDPRCPVWH